MALLLIIAITILVILVSAFFFNFMKSPRSKSGKHYSNSDTLYIYFASLILNNK